MSGKKNMAAAKAVVDSYPWERALRELVTWIIERYIYLESYLENHSSRDDSKPREVDTIPPPPKVPPSLSPVPTSNCHRFVIIDSTFRHHPPFRFLSILTLC